MARPKIFKVVQKPGDLRANRVPDDYKALRGEKVYYRFIADIGMDPETGKRKQATRTFDKLKEAQAALTEVLSKVDKGTFVAPKKITLGQHLDEWLPGEIRGLAKNTKVSYTGALKPVRDRLGALPLQKLDKAMVEEFVEWMSTSGRRRGGKVGTPLSGRSVNLTLDLLRRALDTAIAEGKLERNVAALVKHSPHTAKVRATWSKLQVRKFLAVAVKERLHVAWRLSLYGLRRGEVLGLRWEDIDLAAKTLTINQTRVLVDYEIEIKPPKSDNGLRTLPLDDALVAALKALKAKQASEKLVAGEAYVGSGYVVVDELGQEAHPEWFSDEFERVLKRAGLPRIVLHGARHTTLSLMEKAGVPISILARWAGHYDARFTMAQYVHASDEDLKTGTDALGKIFNIN